MPRRQTRSPAPWSRGVDPHRIDAFRKAFAAQLRPQSAKLTATLRTLIKHLYPDDFRQLDFELDGMTEFDRDATIGAYFFREGFNHVIESTAAAAHYPMDVADQLRKILLRFPATLARRFEVADDESWPCYAAEDEAIRWFYRGWRGAGGAKFRHRAAIGVHDVARRLNLVTGQWSDDA